MAMKNLPLKEISIAQLYMSGDKTIYEIPIYQRNYAWEKDEIRALVQDVLDAYEKHAGVYYIGTLVSYHKGENVYEIIDGQQRLTTIYLILTALGSTPKNRLTYRARTKSDVAIRDLKKRKEEEYDKGILVGYDYAEEAIKELVDKKQKEYLEYFLNNVHMIHYQVPKNIDLNHYFEVMNSRGEQLEKHEIVKARLMEPLNTEEERRLFNLIWDSCSEMGFYIQTRFSGVLQEAIFGKNLFDFCPQNFDEILKCLPEEKAKVGTGQTELSILEMTKQKVDIDPKRRLEERKDSFQAIIDFPNFLLIVLKLMLIKRDGFDLATFILDDKELLNAFLAKRMEADDVKQFGYMLLKSKFLLDNYIVHHTNEEERPDSNPWKLQCWIKRKTRGDSTEKSVLRNLASEEQASEEDEDSSLQKRLTHLLSMFEVSFTARQRKNYLFYCLLYLMDAPDRNDYDKYATFLEQLAERYFKLVYLDNSKLNMINTPLPGSFDEMILAGKELSVSSLPEKTAKDFVDIYGDGTEESRGVPLFVFNYLDYKLWKLYNDEALKEDENSQKRIAFFQKIGCGDFTLFDFANFYFSRTRRSLEHYYPQAEATGSDGKLNKAQINCFGNYAMIGGDANSTGSNWLPKQKVEIYLNNPQKVRLISVASLKMLIMMHICQEKDKWGFDEIKKHQKDMVEILMQ